MIHDEQAIIRRALTTGKQEDLPKWYVTLVISRLLSIPPWEVENAPPEWVERVIIARQAEEDYREGVLRGKRFRAKQEAEEES